MPKGKLRTIVIHKDEVEAPTDLGVNEFVVVVHGEGGPREGEVMGHAVITEHMVQYRILGDEEMKTEPVQKLLAQYPGRV